MPRIIPIVCAVEFPSLRLLEADACLDLAGQAREEVTRDTRNLPGGAPHRTVPGDRRGRDWGTRLRTALHAVLARGESLTRDLGGSASTSQFADAIRREMEK